MRSSGIVRKVDELGRIVLPIELRRTLEIGERDELEIYIEDEKVILKIHENACVFCNASRNLITYRGRYVCTQCIQAMNRL